MMANNAAGPGAQNAVMSRKMPGDATDRCPLQTARRVGRSRNPANRYRKTRAVGTNMNFIRVFSAAHTDGAVETQHRGKPLGSIFSALAG